VATFFIALLAAVFAVIFVWLILRGNHMALKAELNGLKEENTRLKTDGISQQSRLTELEIIRARLEQEISGIRESMTERLAAEHQRFAEQEQRTAQYLSDIEKMRSTLQTEFQAVATKLLDEKSAKFTEQNKSQLDVLLSPLKQQLVDFRTRIDTVYKTESDDRTSLKAQIEQLRLLNSRITDEAHSLTQALKGQSQVRGSWGELILENLLASAGLVKDRDFLLQETIVTEDQRRVRPDVILRLPDQRHLVIDSKLSLIAYEQSINAADEDDRNAATSEHVRAVRTHVEQLSAARYEDTGKLFTPDYVLMFVPLESAFISALQADQTLYQWAFDRRIILCTAPTLLVTLKTVASLWTQDRQAKNVQEIARRGGLLYDKFVGLIEDLDEIGEFLRKAQASHAQAFGKLKTGAGNLIGQVEDLKTLGAKARKSLPPSEPAEG
jgi:DNA recombination protein RmuC